MAKIFDEAAMQRVRIRKQSALLRQQGRRRATLALAGSIDKLIDEGPPEHLTTEQALAYEEELRGQRRRMVGQHPKFPRVRSSAVEHPGPQWPERLDPEDIAELANGGWRTRPVRTARRYDPRRHDVVAVNRGTVSRPDSLLLLRI